MLFPPPPHTPSHTLFLLSPANQPKETQAATDASPGKPPSPNPFSLHSSSFPPPHPHTYPRHNRTQPHAPFTKHTIPLHTSLFLPEHTHTHTQASAVREQHYQVEHARLLTWWHLIGCLGDKRRTLFKQVCLINSVWLACIL